MRLESKTLVILKPCRPRKSCKWKIINIIRDLIDSIICINYIPIFQLYFIQWNMWKTFCKVKATQSECPQSQGRMAFSMYTMQVSSFVSLWYFMFHYKIHYQLYILPASDSPNAIIYKFTKDFTQERGRMSATSVESHSVNLLNCDCIARSEFYTWLHIFLGDIQVEHWFSGM